MALTVTKFYDIYNQKGEKVNSHQLTEEELKHEVIASGIDAESIESWIRTSHADHTFNYHDRGVLCSKEIIEATPEFFDVRELIYEINKALFGFTGR